MDSTTVCNCCKKLDKQEFPHENLILISRIPESSIYRCRKCMTFWMCSLSDGWENLDYEKLWQMTDELDTAAKAS